MVPVIALDHPHHVTVTVYFNTAPPDPAILFSTPPVQEPIKPLAVSMQHHSVGGWCAMQTLRVSRRH